MAMDEDKPNKVDAWIIDKFRPFVKGWMEIVRNALVVGVLIFFARKSNSVLLSLLALFTTVLFGLYCLSYVMLQSPPYRSQASNRYARWALNTGSFILIGLILWAWADLINKVLFQLADVQIK